MSVREDNAQHQKLKTKKLAIASLLVCIFGIIIIVLRIVFYRPWWSEYVARNTVGLLGIIGLVLGYVLLARISKRIASIALLVLSSPLLLVWCSFFLTGLLRSRVVYDFMWQCSFYLAVALLVLLFPVLATRKWKSWLKGETRTGTLATLGIVAGVFLVGYWWMQTCAPVSTALSNVCAHNLKRIGDAVKVFASDKNSYYPDPEQWCDLLLQHTNTDRNWFLCPGVRWRWRRQVLPFPIPKNERCHYAMNPNCEPNSPADTVLLFETNGGWNRFGGPELMTTENHMGYCIILFNDGHVERMNRKHIPDLNWGMIQNSSDE